ncbi:hypothetical protein FOL47_010972 [Perkinsus chesapeaki]|uniref:Phosphatidic acid phosphatase type 2/haloperoxidase domain-containing protein n=1 Tax=Perkinsus chesapeaki TaxID=330153 RepID=A0A7J6MNZ9_PERCH|nr:hypothetical protein FOL47_010972 [Perkinsus chesapeaki]
MSAHPCEPEWYTNSSSVCPYGTLLIGGVTAPNNVGFFEAVSLIYGYCVYAAMLFMILIMLWRRGLREYSFVIFFLVIFVINELGWKHIVPQVRPVGSCNLSCGMPSGHSAVSVAMWISIMLDIAYRIRQAEPGYSVSGSWVNKLKNFYQNGHFLPTTFAISEDHFVIIAAIWSLVLLPTPLSRVILRDHTAEQAFMGGIVGTVEALVWYFIMLFVRVKTDRFAGMVFAKTLFAHNWAAPRCYIPDKCSNDMELGGVGECDDAYVIEKGANPV